MIQKKVVAQLSNYRVVQMTSEGGSQWYELRRRAFWFFWISVVEAVDDPYLESYYETLRFHSAEKALNYINYLIGL